MARGGKKHASTNRRRLSHKWKKVQSSSDYKFPDTYEEFRNGQRKAYRAGVLKGIELFKKHCPKGAKFVKDNGDFDFLRFFNHDVPYESQFDGTLNDGYALDKLRNLNPSELLTSKAEKKEKKITDFLNPEDKEEQKRADQEYTPEGDDSESTVENKNVEGVSSKNCESSSVVDDELIEEKLKPVSVGIEEVSAKKCEPTSVEDDELSRKKVKVVSSGIEETSSMKGATSKSEVKLKLSRELQIKNLNFQTESLRSQKKNVWMKGGT